MENLHHGADPEAAADGVDADDGGGGAADDLAEQPEVVGHHHEKPQRHQHIIKNLFLHLKNLLIIITE